MAVTYVQVLQGVPMTSWLREAWFLDDGEVQPALSLAMTLSRASMGMLLLRDTGDGAMRMAAIEGLNADESILFAGQIAGMAPIGTACAQHRRVLIRDVRADASDGNAIIRELSRRIGFRGMEVVPVERHGAAAIGALTLLFRQPLRITPRAERLTALATALIALALDNARLRAEADRRRRIAEQRAYDRLQFLARINHELRTPLQSITGYIQLLQNDTEGTTQRQRDMLTRIERSEQVLLAIIDDVANLGRLEAGRMTYTLGGVTVADVLEHVDSVVAPLAGRQSVSVRLEMPATDLQAHADRIKLTQVLINLVTNAVKFTPAGGVVRVQTRRVGSRIDFVVRDQGPGIPEDKLAAIFDPYVQLDNRREAPLTGFGLGLAISREFAIGMGGRLVAENASPPERGAIFTCTLRVHRPDRRAWRSRAEPMPVNHVLQLGSGPFPTTQ